jgi:AraC family transcriptional regulator of adaptative response/methylated-DNA-[protein]-cysteine methyltransferase
VFSRLTGLSPAAYARALRDERAREALAEGQSVTEALYEAGFESASRFYDSMQGRLGMAPSAWVRGGAGVTIRWAVVDSSLGPMLVAATGKGVCRLSFGRGREELERLFPEAELVEGGADFAELLQRVIAAVDDPASGRDIPVDVRGTAFQERVWQELRRIPPGETRSYAEIAAAAGNPKAVRAAGSANGANHVPVLIPCHCVVRSDGSLGGYAYGLEIKQKLLEREKQE